MKKVKSDAKMSKLSYPSSGIYNYARGYIETCSSNLKSAKNNCSFDIPSGFSYRSYLYSLSSTINSLVNEIDKIDNKLEKVNSNFENLENSLTDGVSKITVTKVKERDRMIR